MAQSITGTVTEDKPKSRHLMNRFAFHQSSSLLPKEVIMAAYRCVESDENERKTGENRVVMTEAINADERLRVQVALCAT